MNSNSNKFLNHPPLCYINLERQVLRKKVFEQQCQTFGISDSVRIDAYDGNQNNIYDLLIGAVPHDLTSLEIACVLSHLKALRYFVEKTDAARMLVCEDDLLFEMAEYWPFTWSFFESHLPYDWDIVQLVVNNTVSMHLNLHIRFMNDFSTACYLISRSYAEKLLSLHCVGDTYKIDQMVKPRAVADGLLYNAGKAYAVPLLTTHIGSEGGINEKYYDLQKYANRVVSDFWKKTALEKITDYSFICDHDPFINQLPPEVYNPNFPNKP